MKTMKWIGAALACLAAGLLAAGCAFSAAPTTGAGPAEVAEPRQAVLTPEQKAEQTVSRMTDSQKIGQLMMIGIQGPSLDGDAAYMLTEFPCGSVILFDRNMKTPEQVRALTASIQKTVKASTSLPAFIGVDEEGGQVARMEAYLPPLPAAAEVGQGTVEHARQLAATTGKALAGLGINTNFAPVVDLDGAYGRSYGKTPEEVVPFAKAVIAGYQQAGVRTCLKHFPGIGKVKTDPHIDGDVVSISRETLDQEDGRPFRELISQMDPTETFVMVSNVTFPEIDSSGPACLSKTIMTGILRDAYGYQGLILSDDMEMGAMAKHYSFADMGVRAIEAGADIVLVCHDYGHEQEVYNGLLRAYRSGRLDRKMVDEKVKRIVLAKAAGT